MRTVLRSDEIATVWAAQTQPHGRCSSNMSFDGRKFYSYGTVVAEIVVHRGKVAYLVNNWHFSDTTSRHVNLVRCAIQITKIPCGYVEEFDEIASLVDKNSVNFSINLRGHGCLILAGDLDYLSRSINRLYGRPFPES